MKRAELIAQIEKKKSVLCVGLDTDIKKIPKHLLTEPDPIFSFNKAIIDATVEYSVAYKPNIAFYESLGVQGWNALNKTINYLNQTYPEVFTIADAKRGDIGNTSDKYAKAFFSNMDFDSVTVSPYMGNDSVEPFLAYNNKHTILLALTSNKGSNDFQISSNQENNLFKKVLKISKQWKNSNNLMYVVGATKASFLKDIRSIVPNSFLLIPGIGAQGGDLKETFKNGVNKDVGLLVNSSRSIIYAGNGDDFIKYSYNEAHRLQQEMQILLND